MSGTGATPTRSPTCLTDSPGYANSAQFGSVVFDTELGLKAGDVIQFVLRSTNTYTNVSPTNDSGQATFATLTYVGPA